MRVVASVFVVSFFCAVVSACAGDPLATDHTLERTRAIDLADLVGDGVLVGASRELDSDITNLLIKDRGVVRVTDDGEFRAEVSLGAAGLPDDAWHDLVVAGTDVALIRDDEGWLWSRADEAAWVAFCVLPDSADPRLGQRCNDGHGAYDCATGYPLDVDVVTQQNDALGLGTGFLAAPRFYGKDGALLRASVNSYNLSRRGSLLFSTADLDIAFTGIDASTVDGLGPVYGVDEDRVVRFDEAGGVDAVAHLDVDGAAGLDVLADGVALVVDDAAKQLVFYDLGEL